MTDTVATGTADIAAATNGAAADAGATGATANDTTSTAQTGAGETHSLVSGATGDEGTKSADQKGAEGEGKDGEKTGEDGKTDGKKDGEGKADDAQTLADAAKLVAPEGIDISGDAGKEFTELMNDAKLTPAERGQKLLDMYGKSAKAYTEAQTKAWSDLQNTWQGEVKNDPEIGGAKLNGTLSTIAKAIDQIGGKDGKAIRDAMTMTGAGNNPALVKFIYKLSQKYSESGQIIGGKAPAAGNQKTAAEIMYPNQNKG